MHATTTRDRILTLAEGHLMGGGYHAFSFADIARVLGVKAAAVHYYFPSKVDLAVHVVRSYGDQFELWRAGVAGLPPARRLIGYFEIGRRFAVESKVCPLSLVVAQREAVPEELLETARGVQGRILDFYVQTLSEARAEGVVHFEGSPEDMGALVAGSLIGAQLLSRLEGPSAYVRLMRQQARMLGLPDPWPSLTPKALSTP